jgi:hypothetical protein
LLLAHRERGSRSIPQRAVQIEVRQQPGDGARQIPRPVAAAGGKRQGRRTFSRSER